MRNRFKILAVVFAFLLAGAAGAEPANAQRAGAGGNPGETGDQLVEKCEQGGHTYYMSCDQVSSNEPAENKVGTSQPGRAGSASTQVQQQSHVLSSQRANPASKQRIAAEGREEVDVDGTTSRDSVITVADQTQSFDWSAFFVGLGTIGVLVSILVAYRHFRRRAASN